jgi:2-oxoglutarate ferredoxin oxidoreductase subunit alpha
MQAKWGPHSDNQIICLAPASVKECYCLPSRRQPVRKIPRTRCSVIRYVFSPPDVKNRSPGAHEIEIIDRPRPTCRPEDYRAYDADINGVPPPADFGKGYVVRLVGNMHNKAGDYSRNPKDFDFLIHRLHNKILKNIEDIQSYEEINIEGADVVIVAYGTTSRSAKAAVRLAKDQGLRVGLFRPITLWPFPTARIAEIGRKVGAFLVAEMNMGQIIGEVERAVRRDVPVIGLNSVNGLLIPPQEILQKLREMA